MIVVHLVNGPYEGVELSFGELPAMILVGASPKITKYAGTNDEEVMFAYADQHFIYRRADDFEIVGRVYHAYYEVSE